MPPPSGTRSLPWLWIGVGAIVVVALLVLVSVVTSGDDDDLSVGSVPGAVGGTDDASTPGESQGEVWPVTVTGTPLPPWPRDGSADRAIGTQAPGLSGYTFDGTPIAVDPSKGPVMLVYLAHWCPHCNREVPELLKWKDSGDVPADLQVIGVTTAVDPSRDNYPPSEWIVEKGWTWPVLADSQNNDAAAAMGVTSFPFVVILDTDGTVLARWAGELGEDGIQEAVDAALA